VKIDIEDSSVSVCDQDRNRIALHNGLLDIDAILTGQPVGQCLMDHTATWFNTSSLTFPFPVSQADADCPAWIEFLEQIFEGDQDRIAIMQEAFGYCFMANTRFETFFVLLGIGRNGKSTCLSVLRRLLGDENVASLTPEQLVNSYMLAMLDGKLANLCPDMGEIDRVEEGVLKALVSGDPITANRKYRSPLQFASRATLLFATNVLPRFSDVSLGIWRRMIVIPFNYIVPIGDTDPFLLDRLNQELPGILLWALQGAARLSANKRFTESTRCADAARNYRLSCFPILTFLDECTQPSGYVGAHGLWRVYRAWCMACGLSKPKPLHPFIADVQRFRPEITDNREEVRRDMLLQLYGISVEDGLDLGEEETPQIRRPDEPRTMPDDRAEPLKQHPLFR
jgi:putative DNA primase/helicase